MAQKNQIDMLNGPLLKKILLFSLPLAASSVLQQLFNSIDVAVVGRFVGREALAAVGANSPVISLLINLFVGISMGANAIISNQIGSVPADGGEQPTPPWAALAQASRKCTFAQLAEDTPVPNAACGRKTCGYTPQEGEKCE